MKPIIPNWHVPANIRAFSTTRTGGVSQPPFDSLNLGDHVGDDPNAVKTNRTLLVDTLHLPQFPLFLNQIHGTQVQRLPLQSGEDTTADAVYTDHPHQVCMVMTADCLPVLFTCRQGNEVAAAHAGWRGLCHGILEQTVQQFRSPPADIIAWLGPAIGASAFQVGTDVVEQFTRLNADAANAFRPDPTADGKYLGDLYLLATQRLHALGIHQIYGGNHCTFTEKDRFFSYRRDKQTGRMATLIWFE